MTRYGYTLMTEQSGPKELVRYAAAAEQAGFDVEAIVEAVREFENAGFTDVAVVQIGDDGQQEFLEMAEKELLPALRGQ